MKSAVVEKSLIHEGKEYILEECYVRFEVSAAVTMKNAAFWDVTLFGSCKD
jgi:hypothetical protein